jgi:pilus assembly protein FimV
MKKSQRDTFIPTEDFEDLTLFANESFDTQDVDLFEFTSEESSPLTRLKSIILSLDWEINDEILQELADELVSLQAMWQGDKVAEVYLQGLAKIGNYIRTKGAYAHPNSIKLLLTFFYNFEKIISSPTITGDQITQLLKGDVRKFKILQFQITQSEQPGKELEQEIAVSSLPSEQPLAAAAEAPLTQQLKAAILSLDWEVTEDSLMQFNTTLAACHQQMTGNKPALVLLQGLQALGDYIAEEKANSHPDAFSLLHAFNEALEQVIQTGDQALDQSDIQDLLVDRINRLNNLKMVIASPTTGTVNEQLIAGVVEEISAPAAFEQPTVQASELPLQPACPTTTQPIPPIQKEEVSVDTFTLGEEIESIFGMEAKPAMETSELQYPDEILPPDAIHPVDDELADELIDANLSSKRGFAPALADVDEAAGFNVEATTQDLAAQNDLAEQLDFLFADTETTAEASSPATEPTAGGLIDLDFEVSEPIAALSDVDLAPEDTEEGQIAEPARLDDTLDANMLDIETKLDSFFADAIEADGQLQAAEALAEPTGESPFLTESASPVAALSDTVEEGGFSADITIASLDHSPLDEIEEKLDFFFGNELEEESAQLSQGADTVPTPALHEIAPKTEDAGAPVAMLSGEEPPVSELEEALDGFFASTEAAAVPVDELTRALESTLGEDKMPSEETYRVQLASLGAMLPLAIRALDRDMIAQAGQILASLQQDHLSGEHGALAQLLQSVVTMLNRLPTKEDAETEKLVNFLYEQLIQDTIGPTALTDAIGRFSRWLQQAGSLMPLVPSTVSGEKDEQPQEPHFHYTAKELYFELAELRLHMKEEFAKLRHEMHHHH